MTNFNNLKEFLSEFSKEELRQLSSDINMYHCRLKETAKDRSCSGEITEEKYRKLRTIGALLSYIEADIDEELGDE